MGLQFNNKKFIGLAGVLSLFTLLGALLQPTSPAEAASAGSATIMTYNILQQHWDGTRHGNGYYWNGCKTGQAYCKGPATRRSFVKARVRAYSPDIIGWQEVTDYSLQERKKFRQKSDLLKDVSSLGYVTYTSGVHDSSPISWKHSKYTGVAAATLQLVKPCATCKGVNPRYLNYVRLKGRDGRFYSVFNYHYSQWAAGTSRERVGAKKNQVDNVAYYVKAWAKRGDVVILTGDFNHLHGKIATKSGLRVKDAFPGVDHVLGNGRVATKSSVRPAAGRGSDHPAGIVYTRVS